MTTGLVEQSGRADQLDGIVAALRQLTPDRPLNWFEAHAIAERQAGLLLELSSVDEPAVPQFVIHSLPSISVDWRENWSAPGMAVQLRPDRWRIVIPGHEPRWRQRFCLAHEFKHVLDYPTAERNHAHLKPDPRRLRRERLANYFAACLLMPRPWLTRDWCSGVQDIRALARRYYVSDEAVQRRLCELGLRDPAARLKKSWHSAQRGSSA